MTSDALDRRVEETLRDAFSFDLAADSRRVIDRRVESAIHAEGRYLRPTPRRLRALTPRVLVGLAAATVLFAATAVAGGTLFSQLVGGAPVLENVWDRATDVNQSITDAGYTVTLVKVAVDPDRIWVALSVSSDAGGADISKLRVTDANGVVFSSGTGAGTAADGQSATLFGFQVPEGVTPVGPFVLEVTMGDVNGVETPGTWRFTFDAALTALWAQPPV